MKYLYLNNNFITEVWNFVLRNEFSLKFVFWNEFSLKFVLWTEFSLKFCALKWIQSEIQSEILCPEMNSVWKYVFWNEFSLKICALKWIKFEFYALRRIQPEILFSEIFCSELKFFVPFGHRRYDISRS